MRMREVESIKEAGSRGAGLRILIGKRTGSSHTSDLSEDGIRRLVQSAIELADITTEDPHAGLPDPDELGAIDGDLRLHSTEVGQLETTQKIDLARRAEAAALETDPRIAFATFPKQVQEAITDGRVERGMTKEQVIMSLGYPQTHRTASTDANTWIYWYNRWVTYQVQFGADGKVSNIVGSPAPTRNEPIVAATPTPAPAARPGRKKGRY